MKNTLRYIIFFLLFVCWHTLLSAESYTFRNIVMSDGLSGLLVNAIYKDSQGFIWLGTDNCLDRFDGVKVKHFEFRGVEEVRKKRVSSIAETPDKQLWVGNGIGLWRLNGLSSVLERIVPEKIDCAVNTLLNAGDILYIGTDKGLFIQKDGKLIQVLVDKNMFATCNRVMDICLDEKKQQLWLATVQGLFAYSLSDGQISSWHFRENIAEADYFRCVTRIGDVLYLGTMSQGVIRFDIRHGVFSHALDLGCNVISDISSDGKDLVYVATDGNGVHFLSHKQQRVVRSFCHDVHAQNGIRSNSIYSLLVDDKGTIWIGHFQAGLDYSLYQNGLFHIYTYPPMFDSANISVRSFLNRGTEKLIGSRDGLFYINEATGVVKSFIKPELPSNLILSMCFYQGEFYIGTYGGGMMVLSPKTLSLGRVMQGNTELLLNGHVFCLVPDSMGILWIGTSQGVFCYNKQSGETKIYTSDNSQLPEGNVYEVCFDSTGKGWIATENGVCIYDPASQSLRSNVFPNGFVNKDKVRYIYEDSQNNLHFLREKGNLFTSTLSMAHFQQLPAISAVPENSIMSIVEDDLGWLWLGCNDGLVRFKDEGNEYDAFTFNDGLPGPTFTNGAASKDEKGILWFGNTRGLIYVDPKKVDEVRHQTVHPIVFTDVMANGMSVHDYSLKHDQNNLTFCFTDFSYGLPSAMMYEYRLDGVDAEWRLLAAQSEISYYGLSSGAYTFRVRLPGNEQSESTLTLEICPLIPWWAWGVMVILLILGGLLIRYYLWKYIRGLSISAFQPAKQQVVEDELTIESKQEQSIEEKYKTNRLSDVECKELYEKLVAYVEKERPYINPDLKMGDLAVSLGISSHSLSYLLNQYLNLSYYDFVNEYRISEFKKLVADSKYSRYTLVALAELCGFSSRASFFRSFKKSMGVTPNEYIRSIGGTTKEE